MNITAIDNNQQLSFGASGFSQLLKLCPDMADIVNTIRSLIRMTRLDAGLDNAHVQNEYQPNVDKIKDIRKMLKEKGWQQVTSAQYYYLWTYGLNNYTTDENGNRKQIIDPENIAAVSLDMDTSVYTAFAIGDEKLAEEVMEVFKECLPNIDASFIHYYTEGNNLTSESINLDTEDRRKPRDSFYPWLKKINKTVDQFLDDYINAPEAVLILSGPAGTGKTTLIRELLTRTKCKIGYTADSKIMEDPSALIGNICKGNIDMMIFEDSDMVLKYSRKEGNINISNILNTADGLIPNKNNRIKLIFTTNLTDKDSIDKALLRPGRLFDFINCDSLTKEEAEEVCKDLNINYPFDTINKNQYTLAELTNYREDRIDARSNTGPKVGFNR